MDEIAGFVAEKTNWFTPADLESLLFEIDEHLIHIRNNNIQEDILDHIDKDIVTKNSYIYSSVMLPQIAPVVESYSPSLSLREIHKFQEGLVFSTLPNFASSGMLYF